MNFKRFRKKFKYIFISLLSFIFLMSNFSGISYLFYFLSGLSFILVHTYYFMDKNFSRIYWLPISFFPENNSIRDILSPSSILPILIVNFIQLYLSKISLKIAILCILHFILVRSLFYISHKEDVNFNEI